MQIEIVSSFMPDIVIERIEWPGSLASYLDAKCEGWRDRDWQPITAYVDGEPLEQDKWHGDYETIRVAIEPQGGLFKSLGSILGSIFNVAFGWLAPSQKGATQRNTESGDSLESPQGTANTVKIGQVVPELAGRYKRFPDYLTMPHRYFINAREQWLEFHVCIGPGEYDINIDDVKVGDTPLASLGADAEFRTFLPGESIAAYPTRRAWHTVAEVGGTSSGSAGLELALDLSNRNNVNPGSYGFNGDLITRPDGTFPSGWGVGTVVNVEYPKTYTVTTFNDPGTETEPPFTISRFDGWFGHVPADVGNTISLGPIGSATEYRVRQVLGIAGGIRTITLETVLEGLPVVITPGTQTLRFGSNVPRTITTSGQVAEIVSPGGFQEGDVPGALVQFAGGQSYGEWTSEFALTPGIQNTTVLEFDVFFPNGLAFVKNAGGLDNQSVTIQIEYRDRNTGTTVSTSRTYTDATLDQIGFTEQINVGAGRWAARMRRTANGEPSTQVQDKVHWYSAKSLITDKISYPGWSTMMVRLRSGGKLAAQAENQINVIAVRRLPRLLADGTWTAPEGTREIAAFVRYIAGTIGYTDADIDMPALIALNELWRARGDNFDLVFDQTTVKAALDTVLIAGMGELTINDGLIRPVREGVRTVYEHAYSPQSMTGPLRRTFRSRSPEDADGVEVEFTDENTWTRETVQCRLPGDNGFKVERVVIDGVTNRARAWRIGMRRRRELRYRNWTYSFGTELSALNSEYKSYVPLFDDLPGYGQSAQLVDIRAQGGSALLVGSENFDWSQGGSYVMGYRRRDGTMAGPFAASRGGADNEIVAALPQPWPVPTLSAELPHLFVGTSERFAFPALITAISPRGNEAVSVTAVNYDARVYADDDNAPVSI